MANKTEILFQPINNGMSEIRISRGLNTSQKNIKAINVTMINAKPRAINEMNHHLAGLRYGARQESKKTNEVKEFNTTKSIFVNRL